MKYTRY